MRWLDTADDFLRAACAVGSSLDSASSSTAGVGVADRPRTFLNAASSSDLFWSDGWRAIEGFRLVSERTEAVSGASSKTSCGSEKC